MRTSGWVCALLCMALLATGCGHLREAVNNAVDNNQDMRKGAVEKARSTCVSSASARLPKTPEMASRVASYCDCFATKGMSKISNSELMEMGFQGGHMTDAQKAKLNEGVQMCLGEINKPH